jgi:hypothetical protein
MYSIYHFFKHLIVHKNNFKTIEKLENFPFDEQMLSCRNTGQFPDLALKVNLSQNQLFSGGELIELKDSKSYTIASFNSTIPTGKKEISKVIKGDNSSIKMQMKNAGNHIEFVPIRDVFYLIRGKNKGNIKVALVHGSFFETVKIENLISQSFEQVLNERLKEKQLNIDDKIKNLLADIFSEQENFSKVRNVDKASVKLRFRIMTEIKAEGNILNTRQYPNIKDNTISLIVPKHNEEHKRLSLERFNAVYRKNKIKSFALFDIKHHLNGYFTVFQQKL